MSRRVTDEKRRLGTDLGRDGRTEFGVDRAARGVGVRVLEQQLDEVRA